MEFNEKLQKLRKEHNITQEGLADKLNVSRQAVSKWESGSAYPDMEKLISLSRIFNISLDDLVNDKKLVSKEKCVKKMYFKDMIDKVIEFISKSINMFWSMKFSEKIKFLFEMGIIVLMTLLIAYVTTEIICSIFREILAVLPSDIYIFIMTLISSLLSIIWMILGVIVVIKVFKDRYLDYYLVVDNDMEMDIDKDINDKNELVEKENIQNKFTREKKEYKVIIRDPDDSKSNVFDKLLKICINLFKCFLLFVAIPVIILFVFLVGCMIVDLFYVKYGLLFVGAGISIVGAIVFVYLFIEFIYNVIFNRKHAYSRIFIMLIISISFVGIGLGLSTYSLSTYDYIYSDEINNKKDSHIIEMDDELVLMNMDGLLDKIVIDNNRNDIKVDIKTSDCVDVYVYSYMSEDSDGNSYKIIHINDNRYGYDYFKMVVKYLTNKEIVVNNDGLYEIDKIYISEDNLTKIKKNYERYMNDYE